MNKIRNKQKKLAEPLKFKTSNAMFNIDNKLPIKIKSYDIIDRVSELYPLIPKSQISLIIKAFYEVIRIKSITGYKINVKFIFNEFHIHMAKLLKIKHTTSPSIRRRIVND